MLWRPDLLVLHAAADIVIAFSSIAIPLGIAWYMRHRPGMPYPYRVLAWSFGAFVGACGFVHLLEAVAIWHPIYGLEGLAKGVTAAISGATVALVWPLLPGLVRLPSSRQLAEVNARLRQEAESHEATLRDLGDARRELDARREAHHELSSHAPGNSAHRQQGCRGQFARSHARADPQVEDPLAVIQAMARQTARHAAGIESRRSASGCRRWRLRTICWCGRAGARLAVRVGAPSWNIISTAKIRRSPWRARRCCSPRRRSIGLALHELATNAAKFGALSVLGGCATITWRRVLPAGVEIEWSESGGSPVRSRSGAASAVT
jgi:hypothetical protein